MPPVKTKPEELLTGKVVVDCDFRPDVPSDALVHLGKINTTVELISSYKIATEADKLEVFRIVQLAAARVLDIEKGYEEKKALPYKAHATICAHEKEDKANWLIIRKYGLAAIEVWDREQDRIKREEDERRAREERQRQLEAEAEARRIQKEADDRAAELRRQGEMRQAREVVQQAAVKAEETILIADSLADLGTIAPAAPSIGGLGSSRPWVAVVEDVKTALGAIVDGTVTLSTEELEKISALIEPMATKIAKRMQKKDIGWPGIRGERDFGYRVSTKGMAVQAGHAAQGEDAW
jgi:hypothetical protein